MVHTTRRTLRIGVGFIGSLIMLVFATGGSAHGQCEQVQIRRAGGQPGDFFAWPLAISGDTLVVGAPLSEYMGRDSGAASVFVGRDLDWVERARLVPDDAEAGDRFGVSVAISADRRTVVVGAPSDSDRSEWAGSAYVFRFNGSVWVQQQKLVASDPSPGAFFGASVAVFGEVLVVGALRDDEVGMFAGAAYVFRFDGSAWVQEQKLLAPDGEPGQEFGENVATDGNRIVIGVKLDDQNGQNAGAVYVYRYDGSKWVQEQKLLGRV